MNVTLTITLPLTIALVVSGVYCLETEFLLRHCRSYVGRVDFDLTSSNFRFVFDEENPSYCNLIQGDSGKKRRLSFETQTIEFISMEDDELTLTWCRRADNVTRGVTCNFSSQTLAQQFYKQIERSLGLPSKSAHYRTAKYLKNSNGIVLVEQPLIYQGNELGCATLVIKNAAGDPVLIIPKTAVSLMEQSGPTEIDLHISINERPAVLYKFGFSTQAQALNLIELFPELREKLIEYKPPQGWMSNSRVVL